MAEQKHTGLIYIFTGDGKGKTSAALGAVVRALANNWRVGWISWYKEERWGISEHHFVDLLTGVAKKRLTFLPMGKGFYLQKGARIGKTKIAKAQSAIIVDDDSVEAHREAAREALKRAESLLPRVNLLILDEVCNAVHDGLLHERDVLALLKKRNDTHVILTGRNASPALRRAADLVSVIQKEKHPFDAGKLAVKGLDF